ncbi:MAG TPA: hypothetical protein VG269_17515 [Tepidisphaeraceae bacterium]|jgi:hypothetical protein|nr:hypothetical protein [Tepidisphaeraceae bacterium]
MGWEATLRKRLDEVEGKPSKGVAVSIKVRIMGGCFHRQHSPEAYRIIDHALSDFPPADGRFEEHETGPELLVLFGLTTAGLVLTKSVIDLVTTIIKARSEGQKKGDHPRDSIELIVRGFDTEGKMFEEKVMRINAGEDVARAAVEKALGIGLQKQSPVKKQNVLTSPVKASTKKKNRKKKR